MQITPTAEPARDTDPLAFGTRRLGLQAWPALAVAGALGFAIGPVIGQGLARSNPADEKGALVAFLRALTDTVVR